MSLAKGEGSSNHEGKEVIVNDLPIEVEKGEEAPHSELDCSKNEEASKDPDSECPPLIDPWYNTYSHFPMVPGDYSPTLPSHVWLSLEWHDLDVSWVSLASSSCHSLGRHFTHAHPLRIWVGYITRLKGMGGQGPFRYGPHRSTSTG